METALKFSREIPVRHDVDVFVAGGGPAGLAAACTAAQAGKKVFLAEGQSCFGGAGTAGMLPIFMRFGDTSNFYADGFGRQVLDNLRAANGTLTEHSLCYKGEVLKRVYDDMVQASGAEFSLVTHMVDLQSTDGHVDAVILWGKSGLFGVRAHTYIDCTGDGDLAARAGAPFEIGDEQGRMMPGTLCSLWSDIDWEKANAEGAGLWKQESHLPRAFADKVFTTEDPHLPGMIPVGPTMGGGNIGHCFGLDGCDERSLGQAFIGARKTLLEYRRFYREYLPGFESTELVATAPLMGVRETRRILGDYVLVKDDYLQRASFGDEVGRYNYWIDIHVMEPSEEAFAEHVNLRENKANRYQAGDSYGIPYRVLVPQKLDNVLVAGRCVSTDRWLQSSIRVMPGCFITGQSAGMAAAIATERKCTTREVPVPELQARLKGIGAFLPNANPNGESHEIDSNG